MMWGPSTAPNKCCGLGRMGSGSSGRWKVSGFKGAASGRRRILLGLLGEESHERALQGIL